MQLGPIAASQPPSVVCTCTRGSRMCNRRTVIRHPIAVRVVVRAAIVCAQARWDAASRANLAACCFVTMWVGIWLHDMRVQTGVLDFT